MAAVSYQMEEQQLWKCPKHPSKLRRNGVCPTCLRDRLVTLCPNCGHPRPCPCITSASTSGGDHHSFRRSTSLAIPFFRSSSNTPSCLSVFRRSKTKNGGGDNVDGEKKPESNERIEDFARMVTRSRSVCVGPAASRRADVSSSSSAKGRFWRMKPFRSSKSTKVIAQ